MNKRKTDRESCMRENKREREGGIGGLVQGREIDRQKER